MPVKKRVIRWLVGQFRRPHGFGRHLAVAAGIRSGRVDLPVSSAEDLPYFGEPLDKILAVNSMGFWPEPHERLKDLRARLKPGGLIAIASQPRCPGANPQTSQRAAQTIEAALTKAGFSQTRLKTLALEPPVVCVLGVNDERNLQPSRASPAPPARTLRQRRSRTG